MNITNSLKLKSIIVVAMLSASGVAMAAGVPPDPADFITQAMLDSISTPILITMGAVVSTAFGLLTFKLVTTVGMSVIKSVFSSAAK